MTRGPSNQNDFLEQLINNLRECLKDLKWNIKGVLTEDGALLPFPRSPQAVTSMLEDLAKTRIIKMLKEKCKGCKIELGGAREYPDITLKTDRGLYAIDIKTTRFEGNDRVSGFTLGAYSGYFLQPDRPHPGIKYPYGSYKEHIITGIIYIWREKAPTSEMVKIIDIIVHPKWRIASKRTGTGTTRHIGSIKELSRLRSGKGDFKSKEEFLKYWRHRARQR